jgi:hypothetical protein
MKDFLVDIINHTLPIGITLVKITGDENSTVVEAIADDKSVVIKGTFKTPNPDFAGTFGMPNLQKLNTILNIPEYRENATIQLVLSNRNGVDVPDSIHFENATGDFKNDYRFMSSDVINEKLKSSKFKGVNWHVTVAPTVASVQRFKFQSNANNEETVFIARTDGTDLKFYFGDKSSHAGNFVFQSDVTGSLSKGWYWPITKFLSILTMIGDTVVQFSDDGASQITVDSGLIEYTYILPAQSK